MKKYALILVLLIIFAGLFSGNVNAVDDVSSELIFGVGLLPGAYDFNAALKSDIFGVAGNYINMGYSYEEHSCNIGLFQLFIRVNARREDGVTASATVSGDTNRYREQ